MTEIQTYDILIPLGATKELIKYIINDIPQLKGYIIRIIPTEETDKLQKTEVIQR